MNDFEFEEITFCIRCRFREGEFAYYKCENPDAELDDGSGMNVYEARCNKESGTSTMSMAVTSTKCVLPPFCTNLPTPPSESGLRKATSGDKIKAGDSVVYECIHRDKYHELNTVRVLRPQVKVLMKVAINTLLREDQKCVSFAERTDPTMEY